VLQIIDIFAKFYLTAVVVQDVQKIDCCNLEFLSVLSAVTRKVFFILILT